MNIGTGIFALITTLIVAAVVPFLLGILVQIAFREKALPQGIHYGLAAVLVVGAWLALARTPVVVSGHVWLSIVISIGWVGLCLHTGFRTARSFRTGIKEATQNKTSEPTP